MKKKALLFLILIPLLIFSGCGGETDFLVYEVQFRQNILFIYPNFYKVRYSVYVVPFGPGLYCSGASEKYQIKGKERLFSDYLQDLPGYEFTRVTGEKEYIYFYSYGEYLTASCIQQYDEKKDRCEFIIRQNSVSFENGQTQLTSLVFFQINIVSFAFPVSETAIFDIQKFDMTGHDVMLDFDFLLRFYALIPEAETDAGNSIIKVPVYGKSGFVTLALQPDGMTRISFTEGVTD